MGIFPSVSVGWRLSEEKFFEPARNLFDKCKASRFYRNTRQSCNKRKF